MLDRRLRRPLASVALTAIVGTTTGCASTHRFLVDPDATSRLAIEEIYIGDQRMLKFDAAGGSYDSGTRVIRGRDAKGKPIEIALAKVWRVTFRPDAGEHRELVAGDPRPLQKGAAWQPDGRAQFVVKTSGEVLDLRKLPSRVDVAARLVTYTPKSGTPVDIPFTDVAYLQVRDTHPGRTLLCVLGVAFLGFGIGVSLSGGFGIGG
jgi:hypothetical protein